MSPQKTVSLKKRKKRSRESMLPQKMLERTMPPTRTMPRKMKIG
jgi:hypothetical protein